MQNYFAQITSRYGNIRRARGFYLYTEKGVRLIDMYLDGGRSVLGRKVGRLNLTIKQKLDKGMAGFFPSTATKQLKNICDKIFPNYVLRIFTNTEKAFSISKKILACETLELENVLWRPFADGTKTSLLSRNCFLVFPLFATNTTLLFVDKNISNKFTIQDSDLISELELFTITKSLQEMLKARSIYTDSFYKNTYLKKFNSFFDTNGIYLFPNDSFKANLEKYQKMWEYFIDNKILLSPKLESPSIFPLLEHYSEIEKALKNLAV